MVLQCVSPAAVHAATDLLSAALKGALPLAGSQEDAVLPLVVSLWAACRWVLWDGHVAAARVWVVLRRCSRDAGHPA